MTRAADPAHIRHANSDRHTAQSGTYASDHPLQNVRLIARSHRVHDLERRSAIALPDTSGIIEPDIGLF
jgi:hypothetical protein